MPKAKTKELFIEFLDYDGKPWGGFWDDDPKTARRHIGTEFEFSKCDIRVNGKVFHPSRPPTVKELQAMLDNG